MVRVYPFIENHHFEEAYEKFKKSINFKPFNVKLSKFSYFKNGNVWLIPQEDLGKFFLSLNYFFLIFNFFYFYFFLIFYF